MRLGLSDLTIPEIGSLLRLMSALVFTAAKALSLDVLLPASALAAAERIVSSAGPGGLTAGTALEAKVCTYVLTYLLTNTYLLIYLLTSRTALEAKGTRRARGQVLRRWRHHVCCHHGPKPGPLTSSPRPQTWALDHTWALDLVTTAPTLCP